jgi:HlyD family secretion protein
MPADPIRPLRPTEHAHLRRDRQAAGRWLKRGLLALLAVAAVAAVAWSFVPRPVEVEIAAARRTTLRSYVEEDGRTRVKHRYAVLAPTGGSLRRIGLEAGDRVAAGAEVARIRPLAPALLDARARAEAEARLAAARSRAAQARSAVARARAAGDQAARDATRARALAGATSESDTERAELAALIATADLAAAEQGARVAEAEVRSVEAGLGIGGREGADVIVLAPAAGRVLRVLRADEGPVGPGAPLVELGDVAALEVVVDVLSSDAVAILPGAPAIIERWGGPALSARVTRVEPGAFTRISALGVEEQRVNVVVGLEAAPAALGDGFRVETRVQTWEGAGVLVVPGSALFRDGDDWAVYTVRDGRARLDRVEVGHRGRLEVEITRGLDEGQAVVLYPGESVRPGVRLEVTRARGATP